MLHHNQESNRSDIPERWLPKGLNRSSATWTLFCFPFAGGSAQYYRPWQTLLPQWIELCPLQPPGHGERLREEPYHSIYAMAAAAAAAIALHNHRCRKIALFGHSLGALSAFETCHCLKTIGIAVDYLIVSGKAAPQIRWRRKPIHDKPNDVVIKELMQYNGVPREILNNPDYIEIFLPTIRADFQMVETYQCRHKTPLNVSTLVCYGREDISLWRGELSRWKRHTPPPVDLESFPGRHFYLTAQRNQLVAAIVDRLASMVMCV